MQLPRRVICPTYAGTYSTNSPLAQVSANQYSVRHHRQALEAPKAEKATVDYRSALSWKRFPRHSSIPVNSIPSPLEVTAGCKTIISC